MALLDRVPLRYERQWHNWISVRITGVLEVIDGIDHAIRSTRARSRTMEYMARDITYWMRRKLNK